MHGTLVENIRLFLLECNTISFLLSICMKPFICIFYAKKVILNVSLQMVVGWDGDCTCRGVPTKVVKGSLAKKIYIIHIFIMTYLSWNYNWQVGHREIHSSMLHFRLKIKYIHPVSYLEKNYRFGDCFL